MRGRQQSAFANPVLVGAVTVLVLLVAVFLAYKANEGLPFVPTRQLKVDIANGSNLVVGNDVVEGGTRIGDLSAMRPVVLADGQVGAQLTLSLDEGDGRVPVDSTVSIRPRSVLGTKFVQLNVGSSRQVFADGGTLPISQTSVPVQFDDINKMFNAPTRSAIEGNLVGFGDAFTGRGSSLNDTISSLPALFEHLDVVAGYLSEPSTELTRFFGSLNSFMGAISPVAATNARLFTDMASTFAAISHSPSDLESTIAQSPPTLSVSTDSLRAQQPFLSDFASLGREFTPGSRELEVALPVVNPALEVGARTLARTPSLNSKLQGVMGALKSLALAPGTNVAINALGSTVGTLNPMLEYLGPYQTVCDDWDYFWTFLSEHISEATDFGTAQRALLNFANQQTDSVGSLGASQPADGQGVPPSQAPEYLHGPAYGAAVDNQGNADCETGQRGYPLRMNYFDPEHRNLDTDQHTVGDQGPTYHGRPHVPAGETFSRNPLTGPKPPYDPNNP